jgi:hypothetical protein
MMVKVNLIKLTLFLPFLFFSLSSCKKDSLRQCTEHTKTPCQEKDDKTNIRIKNISKYDFCNVTINPNIDLANYGIIKSRESTCYITFDKAYKYAYIRLNIGNKEFILQPIDYVGEQELGVGNFTYSIDVIDFDNKILSITTTKD